MESSITDIALIQKTAVAASTANSEDVTIQTDQQNVDIFVSEPAST